MKAQNNRKLIYLKREWNNVMSLIRGMTTKSDKHKTCELFAEIDWIPL